MKSKSIKGYTLQRDSDHGYASLTLRLVKQCSYDERAELTGFHVRWQATEQPGTDNTGWYGRRMAIERSRLDEIIDDAKLVATLEKKLAGTGEKPADYIAVLEAMGYSRYVTDRRVYPDLVRFEQVLDKRYNRYLPDCIKLGWSSCIVSAVAWTYEDAQNECLAKLADKQNGFSGDLSVALRVTQFIDAGMPVKIDEYAKAPDVTPTTAIITSPGQKRAQEAKEAAESVPFDAAAISAQYTLN